MSDPAFADAASKSVDHIADGVKALAEAAQKIAPHAWGIAVQQQRIQAMGNLALCLFVIIVLHTSARGILRMVQAATEGDHDQKITMMVAQIICLASAALAMIAVAGNAVVDVQRLVNPEYYAAQALLEAVK